MPSKDYRIWLSDSAYIVVDLTMFQGQVISFVVRLMAIQGGREYNVARYDTAHGHPHKDVLHPEGAGSKEEFLNYTNAEVLTFGQNDIRRNWKQDRERYEKEMRKRK